MGLNCAGPPICRFFSVNTRIQPTVDQKQSFQSMVGNAQMWRTNCVNYYRGLEHLWILVSAGGPGNNPLQDRTGESKAIHRFSTTWQGQCPQVLCSKVDCCCQNSGHSDYESFTGTLLVSWSPPNTFKIGVWGLLRLGANYICFHFAS